MKKNRKFLDFDVRAVAGEDRTYWFTASTPARDRMGDIIVQSGWRTEDFLKTGGPILWGHDYYSPPIGRGTEVKVSEQSLDIKVEFQPEDINPFAGMVEKLVAGGWIRTGSVGFIAYKTEPLTAEDLQQHPEKKWGERLFGDLLEFSIVPVPANPEALAQKEFVDAVGKAFGLKADESISKFLPYRDDKGSVNPRLLRASYAAAHGARGGVKITDVDKGAAIQHLISVAHSNGIQLPKVSEMIGKGMDRKEMKELFGDVWHNELLDVLQKGSEQDQDVTFSLIKGATRSQLVVARDSINAILALSEEPEQKMSLTSLEMLTKELASINKTISGK